MFRKSSHIDKTGFGEKPSSSDLGKLLLCEVEYVHERRTGATRSDAATKKRSDEGQAEHLRAQVAMETFHNQRRPTPAKSVKDDGTHVASNKDTRCFVASAVYGASAPETDELRSYRDNVLSKSALGRAATKLYYRVSPAVAKWIGARPLATRAARLLLDSIRSAVRAGTP